MPFKDDDYVPRLWSYDNTQEAVVLSQKELKELRDQLNQEYLRRWSAYLTRDHLNEPYMDYTSGSDEFTDSDGKHIHRLPSWDGPLPNPTPSTSNDSRYRMADGNVDGGYWGARADKDFRGAPVYYSPLDRYVDGDIHYNRGSNQPPTVSSDYKGPDGGQTFALGTSEWRNNDQYQPHGVSDVTKDRSLKHLIDGLANIVDIDKYFGHGIHEGDPVNPYNKVEYGKNQDPYNSERVSHSYRQLGFVGNSTPGNPSSTNTAGTVKDWIAILRREQRNEYYIRACNYQHWIWYFTEFTYNTTWEYSCSGSLIADEPVANSYNEPQIKDDSASPQYSEGGFRTGKLRNNYNPSYYGHRESYTSCLGACTGFCSQTCFHVCDEQCVYMCDDACGYTCMNESKAACGSTCIANCLELCGGDVQQEGGSGGSPCQNSCTGGSGPIPGECSGCDASCEGYVKDEQACSDCVGYCSNSCDTLCIDSCKYTCQEDTCNISCQSACVESGPGKQGCSVATCNAGCDDTCDEVCASEADGSDEGEGGEVLRTTNSVCNKTIEEVVQNVEETIDSSNSSGI